MAQHTSYNIHFVAYSFDKKCDPIYSNSNLEGHLVKFPKCLSLIIISRETLKDRLQETFQELKAGNSNEENKKR